MARGRREAPIDNEREIEMSDQIFEGQVAIVTGSGAGMGKQHALLLASRGAAVVVNDLAPTAQDVVDEIVAAGGKATLSKHDVSDPEQAKALIQTAIDTFGGIHIVISNAAIIRSVRFIDMDYAAFDHIMKINAYGAFNVLNAAWPHLVAQKYGRVVMVSSSSAWTSQPEIGHYAASKGAVLGLAKTLASEGAEFDITVNILAPGAFTQMAGSQDDPAAKVMMETMMPASLVAPVVAWLVRKDNALNGQIIEASAGRAALNFVGSTKGFWSKDLTIEDLIEHSEQVLDQEGFAVNGSTAELAAWMTGDNTGWAAELAKA